ncbi:MAG: EthD family reductase [Candidatus Obscuribacterales bacterium]|nr:EthD family reductase [Candidatus Obscuribacterales bacterium]
MVAKIIALYKQPADPKAFDAKYFNEHVPIAKEIPGLQLLEISRVLGAPDGKPEYHLMVELYFESIDAAKAGLESPEGEAARKHAQSFAGDLLSLMFAEVDSKE